VLVRLRTNELAKGCYFVPRGVIRKNETIEHAFTRILQIEMGFRAELDEARLLARPRLGIQATVPTPAHSTSALGGWPKPN
jgi:hypothetical protein